MKTPVFWGVPPPNVKKPVLLLTAAHGPALAYFLERNPWAEKIPLVRFGAKGAPILADKSGGVHSVEGYGGKLPIYEGGDVGGQFCHVSKVAGLIASKMKPGPVWEISAGASFGFLAMGAAEVGRVAFALSEGTPGAPSLIMAEALGVDIDVINPIPPTPEA
jgi:hypothetical protein